MPRTVNVELKERKNAVLNDVFSALRHYTSIADKVKVDRFYNETPAPEIWKSRAYFIQELKRACPKDIKFISKRRAGTVAVKNTDIHEAIDIPDIIINKNFQKMTYKGEITDSIPSEAHELSPSKYAKAFKEMDNIKAVFKDGMAYFVVRDDGKIIHYLPTI